MMKTCPAILLVVLIVGLVSGDTPVVIPVITSGDTSGDTPVSGDTPSTACDDKFLQLKDMCVMKGYYPSWKIACMFDSRPWSTPTYNRTECRGYSAYLVENCPDYVCQENTPPPQETTKSPRTPTCMGCGGTHGPSQQTTSSPPQDTTESPTTESTSRPSCMELTERDTDLWERLGCGRTPPPSQSTPGHY